MSNMKNNKYNDMFSYTSNGAAMNFSVHGPFDLSRHRGSVDVRRHAKREFWRQVENDEASLPDGCGCYVYCVRAGKGQRPWYVGLAEMQSFKAECFRPHKILAYNQAIALRRVEADSLPPGVQNSPKETRQTECEWSPIRRAVGDSPDRRCTGEEP